MEKIRGTGLSYVERPEPASASEPEDDPFADDRLNDLARESMTDPLLSIVIPVFNEEASLVLLYGELIGALRDIDMSCEIIFVDDGSEDSSVRLLHEFETKDTRIRVIQLEANCGQSTAFDAGFRVARGAYTATLDADLQNDPADLSKLLPLLAHADVVNGVRASRCDTLTKRLSSKIANGVRNWATGASVSDVGCSLRVMRTSYLRKIKLYRGLHRFLPTLLAMEGARLVEVDVTHRARRYGESKYGVANRLFVGLFDLAAVCWMQRRLLHYGVKR
jgi:dolichol-phosphate mannosyltransferase